jgi:hypothetical protein
LRRFVEEELAKKIKKNSQEYGELEQQHGELEQQSRIWEQSYYKLKQEHSKWKQISEFMSKAADLMVSVENFSPDCWGKTRNFHDAAEVLKLKWNDTKQEMENIFGEDEINNMQMEADTIINGVRLINVLSFDGKNLESTEAEVQQEAQVEREQLREMEREMEREKEQEMQLKQLHSFFMATDLIPAMDGEILSPTEPTSALTFFQDQKIIKPLGECIRNDTLKTDEQKNIPIVLQQAMSALPDSIDGKFFATNNFLRTISGSYSGVLSMEDKEYDDLKKSKKYDVLKSQSMFSPYQKHVTYLLLMQDPSDGSKKKCCFVSRNDAGMIQPLIKSGKLLNCRLITLDGVPAIKTNKSDEPSEEEKKFIDQSIAMARMFNGDARWMAMNQKLTLNLFNELGMPGDDKSEERKKFLENIKSFIVVRSSDYKRTMADLNASHIFSSGRLFDAYAEFLDENSLGNNTPSNVVLNKIVEKDKVSELIPLAINNISDPSFISGNEELVSELAKPKNANALLAVHNRWQGLLSASIPQTHTPEVASTNL